MILMILIIVTFTLFVINTCIKITNNCYYYNQSHTDLPFGYNLENGFMLYNYMNCQQGKQEEQCKCKSVGHQAKARTKHYTSRSREYRNNKTNNLRVIKGNKQGS